MLFTVSGNFMHLFTSSTSPFARIVRILLAQKNIPFQETMVDPWSSPEALMAASPACKVPVLTVEPGVSICNTLVIAQYLESAYPESALPTPPPSELAQIGLAFSLLEAFASIIIGRRSLPDFDTSPVGLRRRRALIEGLTRLNQAPASSTSGQASLLSIITVVLVDAIRFRFSDADWVPEMANLDALSRELNLRKPFENTKPY
ncbi:Glutathione S-transferase domain [Pseudomonas sp. JV551A1]|uniref:glutathione S-transferase family protein n=1 Tax=Pseudomonas sp. JV551A1 TaxID=2078787 RepID=UPI00100CFF80|nr:glutathione S-transferase family protein [Pseudomonas sp. JV551A1]SPO55750.1 Glutathione S-transferase domain [Pseudomonas sp. JV551A1]